MFHLNLQLAIIEAINAKIELIVCITSISVIDMLKVKKIPKEVLAD